MSPPSDVDDSSGASGFGRRGFLVGAGAVAGGFLLGGVAGWTGPVDAASAVAAGATRFVPLGTQVRLADNRKGPTGRYPYTEVGSQAARQHIRVQVTGREGIPAEATAAVFTLTAVNRTGQNFVTAYPTGIATPDVSNANLAGPYEEAANLATVRLGDGGAIDVETHAAAELIVDIAGYYVPVSAAVADGRFVSLDDPVRVLDTRHGRGALRADDRVIVDIGSRVPADATSVVVNVTTTGTQARGYFTCFPLDRAAVPDSSNLNVDGPDQTRAAAAVVKVAASGSARGFQVWSSSGGHVIVDLLGYYTGTGAAVSTDGLFVPADPVRIVDTRKPRPARMWRNWMLESPVPAPAATAASAVVLNVTAVDALGWGFLTVTPARTYRWSPSVQPGSSSVNHTTRGQTVANQVITRITERHGLSVYASEGAHVLVDYSGHFTGTPRAPVSAAPSNPAPQTSGPPWLLEVPSLGIRSMVFDGDSVAVTDAGHTWHWTGTGDMGQTANVALFAHRTDAGGPFRNIHRLVAGDLVTVATDDGRKFEYSVIDRVLTSADRDDILAGARRHSGPTVALIACTKRNFEPTSLDWRIIVNARLVNSFEF
ncbi:MAG: hypothetical protein RIR49_182 [Actinomycetota bacterium]